jgi:TPP-dependent pyruvate/acetoin dehydrogenase alpha subunit
MLEKSDHVGIYRTMLKIRKFEEQLLEHSKTGALRGSLHLAEGQEALPAGACLALKKTDNITMTYRGHGYALAKGCDLKRMAAEILGRADGLSAGKGGKMHLFDLEHGVLGANGIVAAGIPTAVGAALSSKLLREDRIALTSFGDGALNQGVSHECFNMAALWKLPMVFLCENNLYAEMTPLSRSSAVTDLCRRMDAYGIPARRIDGNDPLEVYRAVSEAGSLARKGSGPIFIEAITYRTCGHYQLDPGLSYRSKEELDEWKGKSPIRRYRDWLIEHKKTDAETLTAVEQEAETEVLEAFAFALASPMPDPAQAAQGVYA